MPNRPATPAARDPVVAPELLPGEHAARIKRLRWLAKALDGAFGVPGTNLRFGWDSIIGLVPGGGDVATGLLASYIVAEAAKLGVPRRTLWRMAANVAVDMAGGAVPLAGDLFDFAFKANKKNMQLIEAHLARTGQAGPTAAGEAFGSPK